MAATQPTGELKACTRCPRVLPNTLDHFYKQDGRPGPVCRACNSERCAAYSRAHREEARRRMRLWRSAHPEQTAAHRAGRDKVGKNARRAGRLRAAGGVFQRLDVLAQLAAQGGGCYWCREALDPHDPLSATGDHLVPVARGGLTVRANLIVSCFRCNSRRGAKTEAEYWAYLAEVARDGAA